MRSKAATGWGIALTVLGVLCLVAAAVLVWVVVPGQKQLPADTDTTRAFDGNAALLLNPAALSSGDLRNALLRNVAVSAERTVRVTATDGGTARVVDTRSLTAQGTPVGRTETTYAVDRKSLQAAPARSGWSVTPHQGLTVSWPIGAERKDYPVWVNETQSTATARYVRQETKSGVNTYVYEVSVPAAPVKDPQVLGSLPPALPVRVLAGLGSVLPIPDAAKAQLAQALPRLGDPVPLSYTYESTSTLWVEPTSGVVVDTQRRETRRAGIGGAGGNALLAVPVYDVTTAFTQGAVSAAATDAKDAKGAVDLYGRTLPWVLAIVGLLLLVLGVVMLAAGMRRRAADGSRTGPAATPRPVPPAG
jgi:DUF3068 family protein